ncbi:AI-2E family transporter [Saccharibacter sp. 17.LH.SD]|uniref:AI-2E family transporter n=1 Tax=Saccharibacter sp. 17.LH.SD TaxID=2689393 RepID=UPI0013709C37|nr:AI-2E family transporter [Saccharibacter sp. 17.LH.SD]MXV44623.1 AI-2E family transporter [Saccharibacter sp. 17.LH.SD]
MTNTPPTHGEHNHLRLPPPSGNFQRRARGFLSLFFILAGLWALQRFLPALIWGGIFSIALWPLYRRAEERFGNSVWLPSIFTCALALVFILPAIFIAYKIVDELQDALLWVNSILHTGLPEPQWVQRIPLVSAKIHTFWQTHLAQPEQIHELFDSAGMNLSKGLSMTHQVGSRVAPLVHVVILFFFSLLTLFFILKDGDSITTKLLGSSQRLFGRQGETLARQIISSVHGTVSGLVLVGLGEGVVMGIAYAIAGAPQPIIFGLVTAVAAMVPLLGWIAVTGVALLMVATQSSAIAAIIVWVIGAIVLFVADHFIRPVLIGGNTKVPFLWVLLGIFGGAETWGLLGLFLGPAIMACLHLLWTIWTENSNKNIREQKQT